MVFTMSVEQLTVAEACAVMALRDKPVDLRKLARALGG
jgi:hypothetical protein